MYINDRNMVTNTNLKYANSSSNLYVIMIVQILKKIKNKNKLQFFSHSRGTEGRVEATTTASRLLFARDTS